jgi:hypothetical protein
MLCRRLGGLALDVHKPLTTRTWDSNIFRLVSSHSFELLSGRRKRDHCHVWTSTKTRWSDTL